MLHLVKIVTVLVLLIFVGCGRPKCQPPPEQPFQTFTETQWRLVETNDPNPAFQKLNLTNFLILTLKRNYTGDFKRVENNDLFPTPVASILYDVDPVNRRIRMEITQNTVTSSSEGTGGTTEVLSNGPKSVVDYNYVLGRDFVLIGTYTGFRYRFVPFNGAVDPDRVCEF